MFRLATALAAVFSVLVTAGCGSGHSGPVALSPIGGSCIADGNCYQGSTPTCWFTHYLNQTSGPLTEGGYCTSPCNADADCPGAVCIDEGADGKWCFSSCQAPADCRAGYACFTRIDLHCFSSSGLTCDPTAGDGSCAGQGVVPGGCVRRAIGPGSTGGCLDGCTAGVGSCPLSSNVNRQCIVVDETAGGDAFKGAVCVTAYSDNEPGQECTAGGVDALDACSDGAECFLSSFASGDDRCHPMCSESGAACPSGACADVFGLFGSANPIGLCI